jgi:hypothetical protein
MGALNFGIKLGTLFNTSLEVNIPMGLRMVSININDYGSHHGIRLHHVEDPISHQHLMVLAPMH